MPYLIDGHNVIGQLPDIRLDDPNDEALLVQKLIGFAARTNKKCIVVFDTGITGGKSRMSTAMVEVVFAAEPGIADTLILGRIRRIPDPGNWTVVSSDNAVLDAATGRAMHILRSADFARLLQTPKAPSKDPETRHKARDVHLSPREVEEWLRLFGADDTNT